MSTSTASFIISFSMISYPWIRQRWSHERPRQAHLEVLAPAAPPFESICYENVLPQWEDLVNWLYWCFFVPGKGRAPCWSRSGPQGLPNSRWVRIQSLEGVHSQIYSVWLKRYTRQNAFVVSLFPASSMTAGPRWNARGCLGAALQRLRPSTTAGQRERWEAGVIVAMPWSVQILAECSKKIGAQFGAFF